MSATTKGEEAGSRNINVQATPQNDNTPKSKPVLEAGKIPLEFWYFPSNDGTDENLLILLHGLGDTHKPFGKLGRSLQLPQTATLALKAPEQIPYLYEDAFQWYESFDQFGEMLSNPNPTAGIDAVLKTLQYLTTSCAWPVDRIHLFGFAQGGSIAGEVALRWWKESGKGTDERKALGSVVSVGGPLLSHPTAMGTQCPTKVLICHRTPPSSSALPQGAIASFGKGFGNVREAKLTGGEGMPGSKEEWRPVMVFWSEVLQRRRVEGLYEVMSGGL